MEISKPLQNLLKQAQAISVAGATRYFKITASIITPVEHIPVYLVSDMQRSSMFAMQRGDDYRLTCEIQPGLYLKKVIPYSDDLKIEIIEREGIKQTARIFRLIPLVRSNPEVKGNDTKTSNLENFDNVNLVTVNFQMQELGFAILRNSFATDPVFLMATTDNALKHGLMTDGANDLAELTGGDMWRGIDMPEAGDNLKEYKHIEIPDGTRLFDLPTYLQNDDKYGVYSKGLGCFFRKGMFYVFPLFKMGRYETANKVADIFRFPTDAVPTLETTYYTNNKTLTILSTGDAKHDSSVDIDHQNNGTGKRIINPQALTGKAGYFYENGNAITTRSDSISEYETSKRRSGEQISVYDRTPSGNTCKALSNNAYYDGELISTPWDQSNSDLIYPGMPCKYYYTTANDVLVEVEGVILGVKSQYVKNDMNISPTFKESCLIFIFLISKTLN